MMILVSSTFAGDGFDLVKCEDDVMVLVLMVAMMMA